MPNLEERIDSYMGALMAQDQFSGSILVAKDGEVIASGGYGMANREHRVVNTPRTRFRIGSVTKPFTAMAILILQNEGKIQVEDCLSRFLEVSPNEWRAVTLRHLLNHSSGIPEHTQLLNANTWRTVKTVEEIISMFRGQPLDFAPGSAYKYSNSAYVLLGHIIEQVSGLTYREFLKERIFAPLEMFDTGYDSHEEVIDRRASGYSVRQDRVVNADFLDATIPYSAGALYSTVEDLFRWDNAYYSAQLVPKEILDAMFMFNPLVANYGYGLQLGCQFNRRWFGHAGGIHGFLSQWMSFPEDRVCVAVLSNSENARPHEVARILAAIAFDEPYDVPTIPPTASVDPIELLAFEGWYQFAKGVVIRIRAGDQRLLGDCRDEAKAIFVPESELTFRRQHAGGYITFRKDHEGKVTHLILQQQGVEKEAVRIIGKTANTCLETQREPGAALNRMG